MLTGKEKRALRAEGTQLKPELWIGKEGISDGTIQALNNSFNTKELVKIKLQEKFPLEKKEAAAILCQRSEAELVQIIGNMLLLYRSLPENDH
ncbi:MAG: ribosome assembly RNA-binding protein YhbY [candidate division Zixibacteria bacterium]|nr:YhbY family RNA-binding protein [candidate division KSB1 bacterium]NIR63137.1 YhbY family RNA-binding protein [candidate division Zixibacteria bacterium]NIS45122.1 YhbY family RNA-binding protein [candidate division Zixibacteria bacterium]NIT69421.1 YhbY family RNA-binding protein [candidate division KSB1 bacterium]NIU13282.1 YhbY family RNA-binding protein [candidate division Zixibacteria bacterium]